MSPFSQLTRVSPKKDGCGAGPAGRGARFPPYRTARLRPSSASRHRADATEQATADESQDVELMRPLPERHAAAQAGVELLGVARAVEPIREAPVVQHADPAESTALSDLPDLADRRLEAVRVAHHELPAVRLG